jgi:multiple sugar transport system permease protein
MTLLGRCVSPKGGCCFEIHFPTTVEGTVSQAAGTTAPRGLSFIDRLRTGNLTDAQLAVFLLGPAILILGFVLLYPTLNVIFTSLFRIELTKSQEIGTPFVGVQNYINLFTDQRFLQSLWNTLFFAFLTVTGSFIVGLPLALLSNINSPWRWAVRIALLLPWAMPPVLTALMFRWMFNTLYGVYNDLLARIGITGATFGLNGEIPWLAGPDALAVTAMVVTIVWKTSSFVGLVLLGGLQSIPTDLTEAARVDGATDRQIFWSITLPLLRPAIAVALIFRTLSALQLYDFPVAMLDSKPVVETLAMYGKVTTIDFLNFGYGSTLSMALFLVSLGITAIYVRWIRPADA